MMDPNDYFYNWFPALFRKRTRGMTIEERGIYRELIDEYMLTREPLPADDLALADIARVTPDVWERCKETILSKFDENDGFLSHEFCDDILQKQDKLSKKRSKASQKANAKRWEQKKKRNLRSGSDCDPKSIRKDPRGEERRGEDNISTNVDSRHFDEAVEMYNALAAECSLPQVQKLTAARKSKLNARLKDCGGIEGWAHALDIVRKSSFLRGLTGRGNWKADFDFLMQEKSFTKLMEGAYDDRGFNSDAEKRAHQLNEWVHSGGR